MSDTVIRVENLGKKYKITQQSAVHYTNLRDAISGKIKSITRKITPPFKENESSQSHEVFWALKDVSFEVKKGEVIGIIGRNGAGKTTLLKLLSRITDPTSGRFNIKGCVASLLEVGTGFHPELTGRENIFLNGAILGMRRQEIKNKFNEIVEFAEIEKFLDTPVKRYSSGMYVRLAFAVAAHLEPELLIVDEVLAVGDIEFQKKCLGKMENISKTGRTVLLVSHNMAIISNLCDRVMIFDEGHLSFYGKTSEGVDKYINTSTHRTEIPLANRRDRHGIGKIKFSDIKFEKIDGTSTDILQTGMNLNIKLSFSRDQDFKNIKLRIQFISENGDLMFVCSNFHSSEPFHAFPEKAIAVCNIPKFPLPPGLYYIHLRCLNHLEVMDDIEYAKKIEVEEGDFYGTGRLPALKGGILVSHSWKLLA